MGNILDVLKGIFGVMSWLDSLPIGQRLLVVGVACGGILMVSFGWIIGRLRGPEGQAVWKAIHDDVKVIGKDVGELKVGVARLEERQSGFERELRAHDARGRELRKDVREAIGKPLL